MYSCKNVQRIVTLHVRAWLIIGPGGVVHANSMPGPSPQLANILE